MNIDIDIYDINDNLEVNNDTYFLIITSSNIEHFLKLEDKIYDKLIYSIDKKKLQPIFDKLKLNPANFYSTSSLIIETNTVPQKILLVNKNIGTFVENFISVDVFNNGIIWEPVCQDGYKTLGLVYSKNMPNPNNYLSIPQDLLIKHSLGPYNGVDSLNEYSNMSNANYGYWTIDKSKFYPDMNEINDFRIINNDGRYITYDANNNVVLRDRNYNLNPKQLIHYNSIGQLVMGDKCVTSGDDNTLKLLSCNKNNLKQKFFIDDENIISAETNKCLTSYDTELRMNECKNKDEQKFSIEVDNYNFIEQPDQIWKNYKGKSVVLTVNDNPWYLNKDLTIPINNNSNPNIIKKYLDNNNYSPNKFNSNDVLYTDTENKLIPKLNNMNLIKENFENNQDNNYLKIVGLVILIILIIFLVFKLKNKSKK